MRKEEFMRQLETLLADISEEEKQEALAYYWSYFEDAGEENEERILRELESPEKVAATIKADLKVDSRKDTGTYTERGYEDERFAKNSQTIEIKEKTSQSKGWRSSDTDENRTLKIALIVVIAAVTSPIWLSLLAGIISFIAGAAGLAFGFVAAAVGLYIAGGVLFGVGIGQFAMGSVAVGFGLVGAAMFVWAVAILMTVLSVWLCGKGIPWLCKGIESLWKKIFPGKEKAI